MIAWRSNNDTIRDKSLRLLRMNKRREGLRDSQIILQLAEHVVAFKQHLATSGKGISESVQIGVGFTSETACHITCAYLETNEPGGRTIIPINGNSRERWHIEVVEIKSS